MPTLMEVVQGLRLALASDTPPMRGFLQCAGEDSNLRPLVS